ncbi:NADH-quinone oxidoreductase subunit C [Streptomyces acidicola]|uniref:NADH-quinone oxidoreductase subunit C n=1 Tax=Streptomyces acidicola TaxID=2596892 RepID=UPI0034223759
MTGWLPAPVEELFGPEATAEESYGVLTVDVPSASWTQALRTAHSALGCTYFDWLSAVDEPGTGFRVAAHVVALSPVRRLLLRTTVPHEAPDLPTATGVYAGAAWHERETHEMFGVTFEGHPGLDPLLLPEGFEGHPLRKDFVLAARVAKAWPGAKEPGESDHGGPKRRQMLPPGVPDPNEWGPLKGQLPPAPTRPTRDRPSRAAGERPTRAAGDRPVRRTRSASEGSASQTTAGAGTETGTATERETATETGTGTGTSTAPATPRRTRTAAQGSASQAGPPSGTTPTRRSRSAGEGSASQRSEATESREAEPSARSTEPTPPTEPHPERPGPKASTPRSTDAPWHHARPAFDEPEPTAKPDPEPTPKPDPNSTSTPDSTPNSTSTPDSTPPLDSTPPQDSNSDSTPTPDDPTGGTQ